MERVKLTLTNETGLHARPADLFVRTAKLYKSEITIRKLRKSVDAKNIIRVLLLNVSQGTEIEIEADGPDQSDAINDLKRLVESNFEDINERIRI